MSEEQCSTFIVIALVVALLCAFFSIPANANGYHYHRPNYTQVGKDCIVSYDGSSRLLRNTKCPEN